MTKFELDLRICLTNPYVKFKLNVYYRLGDNERKLNISFYFQSKRALLCQKSFNHDQIQTWPVFSYDIFICQIWVKCVQPLLRLWTKTDDNGMTEWRMDGMTERRNRVTLYAPVILWRGIKMYCTLPKQKQNTHAHKNTPVCYGINLINN
jgi:hypothetical protein